MLNDSNTPVWLQHAAQQRALFACLGVSLALHALVLTWLPGFQSLSSAGNAAVLTALFAPRSDVVESRKLRRTAPKPLPQTEGSVPVIASPVSPPVSPKVELAPEPDQVPALAAAQSAPAEVAPAAQPQASQAARDDAASKSASDLAEEASLRRQYLIGLVSAAKLYMRYPPQARERGWEGRVEIRLVIGTSGSIKSALVRTSSRYQILDDQALDMVKKGQPRLQIPPALRGREFSVDIPVTFELLAG